MPTASHFCSLFFSPLLEVEALPLTLETPNFFQLRKEARGCVGRRDLCLEIFQVPSGLAQVVSWPGAGHGQGLAMFLQQVGMLGRALLG